MTIEKTTTLFTLASVVLVMGCSSDDGDKQLVKSPRPVSVFRLVESDPSRMDRLTGSVGSWKTENLGFEVSGRVRFVIEPETDIDGEVFGLVGEDGSDEQHRVPITKGHLLATLDDTRYQLAVNSVEAQIETAIQQKMAATIEVTRVIPAQRAAAVADLTFRRSEIERNRPLVRSGVVTQAEFDKIQADHDASVAALAQVDANRQAKQAEEASRQAKVDELAESLAQAKRDVEDCQLRSPFRGQVAQVHIIPGGVVQAGQPVVTVQMMDPIKVDLEVSAATSRRLNYRDLVDVFIPQDEESDSEPAKKPAANVIPERAIVYTIDPVADSATRTFTVTLLLKNEKVQSPPPADWTGEVVRARDVWELREAPFVKEGVYFVEANAIHGEGSDHYVWKLTNWDLVVQKETAVLNVTKVKVIPGDLRMDWLGLWTFREVTIADGEAFDIERDLVAGELDTTEPLGGDKILLDRQKWRLRPGDLVGVDLSGGRSPSGFFVPIDAIHEDGGTHYVFEASDGHVRRLEVQVSDGPNTLKRIEAAGDQQLTAGMQLVSGGVHYLTDAEAVNVVEEVQVQQ